MLDKDIHKDVKRLKLVVSVNILEAVQLRQLPE